MKSQTLNIALPKELVAKIDTAAKKEYRNRSELIREAVRVYLQNQAKWEEIFVYGRKQAKKLGLKSPEEIDKIVSDFRHGRRD